MSDSRVSSLASGSIGGDSSMSYALPVEVEFLEKKEGFQKRRTNLGFIVGISVCLSIASLLLAVAAAGWLLLNDALSTQLVNLQDEVCLPCSQLTSDPVADLLSPLPDGLEVIKDNNDLKICCASTNAQLAALFKLMLQRQESIRASSELKAPPDAVNPLSTNTKMEVSAHLLWKPGSGSQDKQQWKGPEDSSWSLVRPGLTFHDNTIYVITSGMYYVYCQILYNISDDNIDDGPQVASSYVYVTSLMYPNMSGIVLKSRHTQGDIQDRHSTFVGGQLLLHKGDKLYVKLSHPSLVSHEEKGSFFGMFKVGD